MIPQTAKRLGTVCALALVLLAGTVSDASATHFRYGQITWRLPNPAQKNVVEFRFEMAFRRTFFSPIPSLGPPATIQDVGPFYIQRMNAQGTVLQQMATAEVNLITTQINATDDYFIGTFIYTYTFPANTPPTLYRVYFNNCCRLSTIVDNNHDQSYTVMANFLLDTTAGGILNLGSPVSSSLPVIHVVANRPVGVSIPTSDPDGDTVSVRLATLAESALVIQAPAGSPAFTVASNGVVTWTPTAVGLYAVQVVLTDQHGASSVLDVVYQVHPLVGSPPVLRINGSTAAATLRVPVGYAVALNVSASDPDPVAPITIGSGFLPTGSTMTPSLPAVLTPTAPNAPVTSIFKWTPTLADAGPHPFVFSATDNNFQQVQNSFTVIVDPTIGLYIKGILRDFTNTTADFNRPDGDNSTVRLVSNTLGANGKPVYGPVNATTGVPVTPATIASATTFANWWSGTGQVSTLGLLNTSVDPSVYSFNSTAFGLPSHNFFTYEVHTFYTFTSTDVLHFSSSDDLWVFVNGKLAADLGGVHAAARTSTLTMSAMALPLGLTEGGTYRMDIFYAHRGSTHGASIGVETTPVDFCDPTGSVDPLALPTRIGNAVQLGDGSVRLINPGDPAFVDAAWSSDRLLVAAGFAAEFDFTTPASVAGQGLAFVLQDSAANAAGTNPNGSNAGGLGYAGIPKSIAVEFDPHQDVVNADPAFDQVSIHSQFALANTANETTALGASVSGGVGDLNNGVAHHVRITYSPDPSGVMWLRVYLDGAAAAAVEVQLTLEQMLSAFPDGVAYVGFTTSRDPSPLFAAVTVSHFEFGSVEPSPAQTTLQFPPNAQAPDTLGHVIVQARDACNVRMRFGGMALHAAMSTDQYNTDVTVTDNLDGTYLLQFTPRVGGAWQLNITSAGTEILNSPFTVFVSPATPTLTVNGGTFPYNGLPREATGTATGVLGENVGALTFSYNGAESAIDAGTYSVIGTFAGDMHYEGASLTAADPLVITTVDPTVHVDTVSALYDRHPHSATGTATGVNGELLGALSFTYDGSSVAPTNAHTYAVIGTYPASTNYNSKSAPGSLEIHKAVATVHVNAATYTYDALSHPATGSVSGVDDEDLGVPDSFSYSPGPGAPLNAGAYEATGIYPGSDNYTAATGIGTITIDQATPTVHVDALSFTYDASAHSATGSVSGVNGENLGSPTAFSYAPGGSSPVDAGTYDVLASYAGGGNYKPATGTGALIISRATPVVHIDTLTFTYDGQPHAATGTVTGVSGELLSPLSFTYNAGAALPVNAGPYVVGGSFAAAGNYGAATGAGSLTILKATPVINWAPPGSIVYGVGLSGTQLNASSATAGTFTYSPEGGVLHAGSRTLSVELAPSDSDNYNPATADVTLVVSPAALTITANDASKAYGAPVPALSAAGSGFVNGDTLASLATAPIALTAATAATGVGAYPITVGGASSPDYDITFADGTLTIGVVPLTITANNASKVYGASVPALSASGSGFVNGDTLASLATQPVLSTAATSASPAGGYPILVSGATSPNYAITFATGTLTVGVASLTITANDASKVYGAAVPSLSASGSGFVNGDTLASLATPPVLTTSATPASAVGGYPIGVSGATSPNYTITFAGGTLTVGRAPLAINANNASKIYGAPVPALSASGIGFVNGDTLASLATPPVLTTSATSASPVGGYPIGVSGATSPNYTITFAGATLAVGQAPLTITAQNKTMTQGFPVPPLTAAYAGFVNGDTVASLSLPVVLTTTGTPASLVGAYPIVASGAVGVNYAITLVNGTLTITSLNAGTAAARDNLAALLPGSDPATAALLNKAMGRINEALDPSLWADASHLNSQGQKVFESLRQAIGELLKVANPSPAVTSAMQLLLDIARQLASDAINVAQAAGRNVTQAWAFLTDGDAHRASGDVDGAMQRYKQAWQQAS